LLSVQHRIDRFRKYFIEYLKKLFDDYMNECRRDRES